MRCLPEQLEKIKFTLRRRQAMRHLGKRFGVSVTACLLLLLLPGAALAEPKGRLIIGIPTLGGERLDYTRPSGSANWEIRRILSRELVELGPNGEYVPGVAQSWKASADGKTWDM